MGVNSPEHVVSMEKNGKKNDWNPPKKMREAMEILLNSCDDLVSYIFGELP
jgi:hypothetical protein